MIGAEIIKRISDLLASEISGDIGMSPIERADIDVIETCIQETMDILETQLSETMLEKVNRSQLGINIERWWDDHNNHRE